MKKLSILKSKEDGSLTLSYKGIDLESYDYIAVEDFIEQVEGVNAWDEIEQEIYAQALKDVGLDYAAYDDPDILWRDFLKQIKK